MTTCAPSVEPPRPNLSLESRWVPREGGGLWRRSGFNAHAAFKTAGVMAQTQCSCSAYVVLPCVQPMFFPPSPVPVSTGAADLPPPSAMLLLHAHMQVVAGFAENQQYGLGTNSMTGDQKSLLIYGTLAVFFLMFLAGAGFTLGRA